MRARTEKRLNLVAGRVLKKVKKTGAAVDIVLLSGRELGRLKARFGLKKPGVTPDILAFPEAGNFPDPEGRRRGLLGEIYLNRELSRERLDFLLIHGILHLLGFSHKKKNDTLRMENLEKKILKSL